MHQLLAGGRLNDVIGEVDQELSKATLRSGIVAEYGGERGIAEGFREALTEGFAGASVIAKSVLLLESVDPRNQAYSLTARSTSLHA
jgi:hypothetical protein